MFVPDKDKKQKGALIHYVRLLRSRSSPKVDLGYVQDSFKQQTKLHVIYHTYSSLSVITDLFCNEWI